MTEMDDQNEDVRSGKARRSGGGSVTQDGRLTGGIHWALGAIGVGLIGVLGWVALSIMQLNQTVAGLAATTSAVLQRVADVEERTRYLERRQP
jgi:hypothetical protein